MRKPVAGKSSASATVKETESVVVWPLLSVAVTVAVWPPVSNSLGGV